MDGSAYAGEQKYLEVGNYPSMLKLLTILDEKAVNQAFARELIIEEQAEPSANWKSSSQTFWAFSSQPLEEFDAQRITWLSCLSRL